MHKPLTSKQKLVLATISDLTSKLNGPPTLEHLRQALGYPRVSSVQRHTDALKKKGYLTPLRGLATTFSSNKVRIPLVGRVAAGTPILATENIEAFIPYNSTKLRGSIHDYFFLRAIGDSMNNSNVNGKNIDDGDFVLIKNQPTAEQNQKVLALIGEEATIKKFGYRDGMVVLSPESTNPANKPIYVVENLMIQGVICDVIKKRGETDG